MSTNGRNDTEKSTIRFLNTSDHSLRTIVLTLSILDAFLGLIRFVAHQSQIDIFQRVL